MKLFRKQAKVYLRRVKSATRFLFRHYALVVMIVMTSLTLFLYPRSRPKPAVQLPASTDSKFSFPTPTPDPTPVSKNIPLPAVSAEHFMILDRDSKQVMYQKDADDPVPPASTTKIMTALVALDSFPLTREITVNTSYSDGQVIGFKPGEILTVEQLLYALLVQSGNDAAEILAENFPGGRPEFISAMNAKAANLRLTHTAFTNPTGLDEEGHFSSAADLARLADVAMDNSEFARIVGTENAVLPGNHVLTNLNQLLGKVPGVLGIKTGFTDNAGQALVTLVNRGHTIILVVLKSTDRFSDTQKLIDWSYSNFSW